MNRYTNLEAQADCGLGAEEPEIHRFTRLSERSELHGCNSSAGDRTEEESPGSAATDSEASSPTPTKEEN